MNSLIIAKAIQNMNTTQLYEASWTYRDDPLISTMIDEELKCKGDF